MKSTLFMESWKYCINLINRFKSLTYYEKGSFVLGFIVLLWIILSLVNSCNKSNEVKPIDLCDLPYEVDSAMVAKALILATLEVMYDNTISLDSIDNANKLNHNLIKQFNYNCLTEDEKEYLYHRAIDALNVGINLKFNHQHNTYSNVSKFIEF